MPQDNSTLLTVTEAAKLLNISPRSVQRRITAGQLPARKLGVGGTAPYVIDRADVDRLLSESAA